MSGIGDILNIFLIIGIAVVTACAVFTAYYLIRALKSITNLANSLENTALDVRSKLQLRVLTAIPSLLVALVSRILKRRG